MTKLTLQLARFPAGAGAAFVTQYMINEKLVEKAGTRLGYELDVKWQDLANAVAVAQGLAGGQLDIGPMGSSAFVGLIDQGQPVAPLAIAEGSFKFLVCVRPDSPVKNLADLKGKTVGTIVGTDFYNVLAEILRSEYGTADPAAAGVNLANVSGVAQLARVPDGADASIVTIPAFLAAAKEFGTRAIVNSFGYTEDAYSGPLGQGAGKLIPSAQKSAFWPEGFYGHRAVFVARDGILKDHPKAVSAFILAHQEALRALSKMNSTDVAALVAANWGLTPADGKVIVEGDLIIRRGWSYLTEGDANVLFLQGKLGVESGAIKSLVPWDKLQTYFAKSGDAGKLAYETGGSDPASSVIMDITKDARGAPNWQTSTWKTRT